MKKRLLLLTTTLVSSLLFTNVQASETFRVLAKGSDLSGPNGLMFDSEDNLYVTSIVGKEIVVMDPDQFGVLERISPENGVGPDDVAFGPDGALYWTSPLDGIVGRIAKDGTVTTQFVAIGVNPITFSDTGRLFVGLNLIGVGLYELDPMLQNPPRALATDIGFLNGMDWGPDGKLYAPMPDNGEVVRIDVDTSPAFIESAAGGMVRPVAVKFDSQDQLHAIDNITGEIWQINHQTGSKELYTTTSAGMDNLAFDSSDRLFIANSIKGIVGEVSKNGDVRALNRGGMSQPGGVAVLPRKNRLGASVFVADVYSLREYNSITGRELSVHGDSSGIYYPFTVSPQGKNLILTSWFANTVQIWDPRNKQVVQNHFNFVTPTNAINFQGDLIVAELGAAAGAARILRVRDGETTTLADVSNSIYLPTGLAANDDNLWVSDAATGIVWRIAEAGQLIPVASGLASPEGLALDKEGHLLVVEAGADRLSRINLETGAISIVKEGLKTGDSGIPGTPPTYTMNGVAVSKFGRIFITGDRGNVIHSSQFKFRSF